MEDYTLESIAERLRATVKDLPGYSNYYNAQVSILHVDGFQFYVVSLVFQIGKFMRGPHLVRNESKEWAVENAFIELNNIVQGINKKPSIYKKPTINLEISRQDDYTPAA